MRVAAGRCVGWCGIREIVTVTDFRRVIADGKIWGWALFIWTTAG
jgi:hypothetical protein